MNLKLKSLLTQITISNISQDKNPFSLSRVLMDTIFTLWQASKSTQDTSLFGKDWTIILADLMKNGFKKFNTKSTQMSTISNSKSNSFHSSLILIWKHITMEAPGRHPSCKSTRKFSVTANMSELGVKLRSSTHTELSDKLMSMSFLNSLI